MNGARAILIWPALILAIATPIIAASQSPLLAWREPVYIMASFAGIAAFALFLLQPLLAAGRMPGLPARRGRRVHLWVGCLIVAAVVVHVGGLWVTSPPDVVDALLFASPTPFSLWGVIAMWALFAAALVALLRRRLHMRPRVWRLGHTTLVSLVVACTGLHILLIEGTLGIGLKVAFSIAALAILARVLIGVRIFAPKR